MPFYTDVFNALQSLVLYCLVSSVCDGNLRKIFCICLTVNFVGIKIRCDRPNNGKKRTRILKQDHFSTKKTFVSQFLKKGSGIYIAVVSVLSVFGADL